METLSGARFIVFLWLGRIGNHDALCVCVCVVLKL